MSQISNVDLWRCNETELYQLCRSTGIQVLPGTTKQLMIAYLMGEEAPLPIEHPIDSWREGITGFVFEYWSRLEPQLTCPIKSKDPRSCWGCLDTQVITCVVQNPGNEHRIQLHRKLKTHDR